MNRIDHKRRPANIAAIDPKAKRRAIVFLLIAGAILWLPVAWLLLGHLPGFLRGLGFFTGPSGTPLEWAVALVVAFAYTTFTIRNNSMVREHRRALSEGKALGVTVSPFF